MLIQRAGALHDKAANALGSVGHAFNAATRWYVSWQFFRSGLLKLGSWDTTLALFRHEYRVPALPPELAAWLGTAGELVFPLLLAVGIATRYAAAGLLLVNAMAVVAYSHVLLAPGGEAAFGTHLLWGYMLLVPLFYGGGALAADRLIRLVQVSRRFRP